MIQTIKRALDKKFIENSYRFMQHLEIRWLQEIWYNLRCTPTRGTNKLPNDYLFSYKPRIHFSLVKQSRCKLTSGSNLDQEENGSIVWVLSHQSNIPRFIEGTLIKKVGCNTFLVEVMGQQRHQLRFSTVKNNDTVKEQID